MLREKVCSSLAQSFSGEKCSEEREALSDLSKQSDGQLPKVFKITSSQGALKFPFRTDKLERPAVSNRVYG